MIIEMVLILIRSREAFLKRVNIFEAQSVNGTGLGLGSGLELKIRKDFGG